MSQRHQSLCGMPTLAIGTRRRHSSTYWVMCIEPQTVARTFSGSVLYIIALTMITFAMRGDISLVKVSKLQRELRQGMPYLANLSAEDVRRTWDNFGHLVDHTTIGDVLQHWTARLPGGCIRLRVCLAQAAGSGLVSLYMFARALREHKHFPWPLIQRLYPDQWAAAVLTLQTVQGNPHFGFKTDLEHVNSRNYANVAWVCGRILIRAGDETLAGYKGFKPDTPRVPTIEAMITKHLADGVELVNLTAAFTEEVLAVCSFWPPPTGSRCIGAILSSTVVGTNTLQVCLLGCSARYLLLWCSGSGLHPRTVRGFRVRLTDETGHSSDQGL